MFTCIDVQGLLSQIIEALSKIADTAFKLNVPKGKAKTKANSRFHTACPTIVAVISSERQALDKHPPIDS